MTAAVKCAPPHNKPNALEISNCSQYLLEEVKALEENTEVILTLGKIAFDAYCKLFKIKGLAFIHSACYPVDGQKKTLLVSYHPSRRNTSTGKLTWQMWIDVFKRARSLINR
jgi:uracil-DNA glycosylase family 4